MRQLLEVCIRKLRHAGFTPVSEVWDMGAPNQELYRLLGVTVDRPEFTVDGEDVVALPDIPHLHLCLRNTAKNISE